MSDASLRLVIFLGVFALFAGLEALRPRREAALPRLARWPGAAILLVIGGALSRLVLPFGLAGIALWAEARGIGLMNMLDLPALIAIPLAIILMDLAVWAQHVAMHRVPIFWRMHRVHHADPHLDVTTALRFHPAEILISLLWKGAVVILLGAPAIAAFWFEVILNALAQFNHANVKLPLWLDRSLRILIVTPDMHRVHHSVDHVESNRNFGFCLSIWDQMFRLYKAQPDAGHEAMTIGQTWAREAIDQRADRLLLQPLKPAPSPEPV